MSTTMYPHLETRPDGTLVIAGTGVKVVMLAMAHLNHGWGAEELARQFPQLTLGQVHGALAYYYDHEAEMNALIEDRLEAERGAAGSAGASPLLAKLRALKSAKAPG